MGLNKPTYITVPSTGGGGSSNGSVSPWQQVDDVRNPVNIGFSIYSSSAAALSSQASIQVTFDDPFGIDPHPFSPGVGGGSFGLQYVSTNPFVVAFQSSNLGAANTINQSSNGIGLISAPIRAWRVLNNSTAGTVVVTSIQSGPR